ncbi:MAG: energy-coupling factor transporter transmembrane protein EcfT [Treponema sp.]|jgi:biotin transport system permease protein|nr:energy-coupling factor transporter transmembrane protein EcfT [Treponema sp.]
MAGKLTPSFGYRAGKTILHRMPAGLKLVFVVVISVYAFASVYGLAFSVLFLLIASAFARIPPHVLIKGSKPLVLFALCVIMLKTINTEAGGVTTPEIIFFNLHIPDLHIPFISGEGFVEGLLAAARIFVPFAAAALLFSVTTMRELRLSLALVEKNVVRIFSPRRKHIPFFSLGISLMLGFIPRFFQLWDDANLACDSRSCKRGLCRFFLLIPLVTERMMEASANTALALEARAYSL